MTQAQLDQAVATATGATCRDVPFGQDDFNTLLPQIAAYMDDPVADYAVLPTWKLAETARQFDKVVLSGEGGDERLHHHRAGNSP